MPVRIEVAGDVKFTTTDINSLSKDERLRCILELEQLLNLVEPQEVFVAGKKVMFHLRFHLWEKKEKNVRKTKKTKKR